MINNEFVITLEENVALQSKFTQEFMKKHLIEGITQGVVVSGSYQPLIDIII